MRPGRRGLTCGGFWEGVAALPNGFTTTWMSPALAQGAATLVDVWSRLFSPYQLNPFDFNPLRDLLQSLVDFEALRAPIRVLDSDGDSDAWLIARGLIEARARVPRSST